MSSNTTDSTHNRIFNLMLDNIDAKNQQNYTLQQDYAKLSYEFRQLQIAFFNTQNLVVELQRDNADLRSKLSVFQTETDGEERSAKRQRTEMSNSSESSGGACPTVSNNDGASGVLDDGGSTSGQCYCSECIAALFRSPDPSDEQQCSSGEERLYLQPAASNGEY